MHREISDPLRPDTRDFAQRLSYSSWRRHQTPSSLRPLGARSSHCLIRNDSSHDRVQPRGQQAPSDLLWPAGRFSDEVKQAIFREIRRLAR